MKLNLLPTTEKKSRQGRFAILIAAMIVAGSIGAYIFMTLIPKAHLEQAKEGVSDLQTQVANVKATSDQADTIIAKASDVIRNAQLAQAMIDHNDVYPKLYDDVKKYIPPYYRLESIKATPNGTTARVELIGTLNGYQRYADLMLALMRFKDAVSITRSGYVLNATTVPALTEYDQFGKPRKANEAPIPDDGLERLAYFQAQAAAQPTGYLGTGNFGTGTTDLRDTMPSESRVTIIMDVNRNLQVPLAAETLKSGGGAAAGGAPTGFGPPTGFGGPAGPPGVGASAPGAGAGRPD